MSSVKIGDALEADIFKLLSEEIEADRFWVKKDSCRIFRKKGYFSQARQDLIIFDVSIEVYLPGADTYSLLILVECKNYGHPVPVDDVEEFCAKIDQVAGVNTKGIVATTHSFQKGALAYAKSKGIGLIRYVGRSDFKWLLNRSASASASSASALEGQRVELGLLTEKFRSQCFDLFCQTPHRLTNSLWDLFDDLTAEQLNFREIYRIGNQRAQAVSRVRFIPEDQLEATTTSILTSASYDSGEVPLEVICESEKTRCGLCVIEERDTSHFGEHVLATISFDPSTITLLTPRLSHRGRARFTLAHELGHHFLQHFRYMAGEWCDEDDLALENSAPILIEDIRRMEWQANHFASCLLLPKKPLCVDLWIELKRRDIHNKGFGPLYVDHQRVNIEDYRAVTNALMIKYGVSRAALSYRLTRLGLLNDVRDATSRDTSD